MPGSNKELFISLPFLSLILNFPLSHTDLKWTWVCEQQQQYSGLTSTFPQAAGGT